MTARQLIRHGQAVKVRKGSVIYCRYAGKKSRQFAELYLPDSDDVQQAARLLLTELKAAQDDDDAYNAVIDGRVGLMQALIEATS
jgi:hypothetical protein